MIFLLGILSLIGYVLAIKLPLAWQLCVVLVSIWYANSEIVRRKEITGLLDIAAVVVMLGGMLFGNVIYFFAHNTSTGYDVIKDILKWFLP